VTTRRRNDRPPGRRFSAAKPPWREAGGDWLWGVHAVIAALDNGARTGFTRLVATPERARALAGKVHVDVQILPSAAITALLPQGAVHQGLALDAPLLEPLALLDLATPAEGFLVMLDQVTDPQNVGAIFRSAAAFGARGVILQDRHAPRLAGALAKAAAGAIDKIAHAREINLSRTLERLEELGWRAVGLDGQADMDLGEALDGRPTILVMGSEGEGIRRLVREHCDTLARIPVSEGVESLNVAAAAAVAFYEAGRALAPGVRS
jgi:23S rRNA (guanosine2251-2'-O)-methyltransferase